MTADELKIIKELYEEAAPLVADHSNPVGACDDEDCKSFRCEFYRAARSAVPRLIAEVERLRACIRRTHEELVASGYGGYCVADLLTEIAEEEDAASKARLS